MRTRERPHTAQLVMLPPELRQYDDPSVAGGRGPGMDAYASRDAWLAARRAWEAAAGMTTGEWFEAVVADGARAGDLIGMNAAMAVYFTEDDEDFDPRIGAAL